MLNMIPKMVAIYVLGLCSSAYARFVSPDTHYSENPQECVLSPIECNLYSYAKNNPLKYIDPSGRYSEDVHNQIIDATFKDLPASTRNEIKIGSRAADGGHPMNAIIAQLKSGSAPIHSMTEPGISRASAQEIRNNFIAAKAIGARNYFAAANEASANGNSEQASFFRQQAWRNVGQMLHPIQDSTSPAHQDHSGDGQGWGLWKLDSNILKHGNMPNSLENTITSDRLNETVIRSNQVLNTYLPEALNGTTDQIQFETNQ